MSGFNIASDEVDIMSRQNLWSYIDHTLLKTTATWDDIYKICKEAVDILKNAADDRVPE